VEFSRSNAFVIEYFLIYEFFGLPEKFLRAVLCLQFLGGREEAHKTIFSVCFEIILF
jgi:hypothetical protein